MEFELRQLLARPGAGLPDKAIAGFLRYPLDQVLGNQVVAALVPLHRRVAQLGMERQRQAGRQRPRRGGPDDRKHLLGKPGRSLPAFYRVAHPDGRAGAHLVLDLGFCQGGLVVPAPQHRLQPFIDVALFQEGQKGIGDDELVLVAHGQVGLVPLAQDAQPLEIAPMQLHEALRVGPAGLADFQRRQPRLARTQLPVHVDLNRQPVAVPPRHEGGIVARHRAGLDYHVFENLVDGRAQVDVAVGVGRPVVEHKDRRSGPRLPQALVEPLLFPAGGQLRLSHRQVGFHREAGVRQVERFFQVQWSFQLCLSDAT